ncbi:MAG: hypothetical protein WB706_00375 [Nitrososphaeraceae archaeon]
MIIIRNLAADPKMFGVLFYATPHLYFTWERVEGFSFLHNQKLE